MGDEFRGLVSKLRARMTFDYMTISQLTVYVLWWSYYISKSESDQQAAADSEDKKEMVPLVMFAMLMPIVLREAEEDGLAVWPNLMYAAFIRSEREFSKDEEWERLETETKSLQRQLLDLYIAEEPQVCAGLLPGDLLGTKNEAFPDDQLMKTKWANPKSHKMSHAEAVKPTVYMLGDVNTIYRPHPRSKSSTLEFRTLIPSGLYQNHWKIVRRYNAMPSLEALQNNKVNKDRYTHIALPSSTETRKDYSALANKPHQNVVAISDFPESAETTFARGATKLESVRAPTSRGIKRESAEQGQGQLLGAINQPSAPEQRQPADLPPQAKRPCVSVSSSRITTVSTAAIEPLHEQWTSDVARLQTQQPSTAAGNLTSIDHVLTDALRMGWVPPQRVAEVARAQGLLDPNLETDRAKMALFIFERLRVRAAPSASLNFEKDDLYAQHLLEDLAPGGHPVCTHLSRRPAEGVLRALQVILLAFTPLTKKLASTLHYITTGPTPSDIIALRSFEEGLSDLLAVCNRVSVISNAFATAQSRHNSDPRHEIEPSLTNSLMDYFRGEFGENLSVEFYARLSTASWIVSSPSEAPHSNTATTIEDLLSWSRDLQKFYYASAIVAERCCAASKMGCHEAFLPRMRARLWREWTQIWEKTNGPWRLHRKHEMQSLRQRALPRAGTTDTATTTALGTPNAPPVHSHLPLGPATRLSLNDTGYELQAELIATSVSDLHGDQDIAAWLTMPCDVGRSYETGSSSGSERRMTEDDGLHLHKGRYWVL